MKENSHVCIATLGGQPQVVTLALDALFHQEGYPIQELIVVHLSLQKDRYQHAYDKLSQEFTGDYYDYANRPCRYRGVCIENGVQAVADMNQDIAVDATLNTFQQLIQQYKQQRKTVHLCISGGRRLLGMLAMSTAMIYFNQLDRIWHVFSSDDVRDQTDRGQKMHMPDHAGVRLLPIRFNPWGHMFPALRPNSEANFGADLDTQTQQIDEAEYERCRQVFDKLSPRQGEVLQAFASGLSLQEVANTLSIEVSTVHSHKRQIFMECNIAWNRPIDERRTYHWLRDKFASYF